MTDAQLRERIGLARGQAWHLVLDLERAELQLMLGGVRLQAFACRGIAVGHPRRAFRATVASDQWSGRAWTGGELDPPRERERVEMVPEPGNAQASALPPPLPGPTTFRLRFAEGLDVVIDGDDDHGAASLGERLRLLAGRDAERLRLRVVLDPGDARDLYACLPPACGFVVQGRPRT